MTTTGKFGPDEPAAHLDIPDERRVAHKAHAAMVAATVRKFARDLPLTADVDDFRRVLVAAAPKGGK